MDYNKLSGQQQLCLFPHSDHRDIGKIMPGINWNILMPRG